MRLSHKLLVGASACLMVLSLSACGNTHQSSSNQSNSPQTAETSTTPDNESGKSRVAISGSKSDSSLAKLNYKSGTAPMKNVNDDKSTLSPKSWTYDHVQYANLDKENRASTGNTAYLDKDNLANGGARVRQVIQPTGWHQKFVNGTPIINRGHEIAYSLSGGIGRNGQYHKGDTTGDQNNPKNLFTQSALSNQKVQTIYETQVRHALQQGKRVIYQVKPIFQGKDLMAKGVHMQAISTDGSLDFNVYLFNVQSGIKFNYATGRSTIDRSMNVSVPASDDNYSSNNHYGYGRRSYYNYGGYGRRPRHHYLRDAAIGYGVYRIGKHMGRRRAERRATSTYRPTRRMHIFHRSRTPHLINHHPHYFSHPHYFHSGGLHSGFHSSGFHMHSRL